METEEHNPGEPQFGEHDPDAPHNPGEPQFGEEEEPTGPPAEQDEDAEGS
jgi:hypothetical protein